jgi:hypothetical protein
MSIVRADMYLCNATFDTGIESIAAEEGDKIDLSGIFLFVAVFIHD